MKKNISMAVMVVVSGLAMTAGASGAQELNSLNAAGVAASVGKLPVPAPSAPVNAERAALSRSVMPKGVPAVHLLRMSSVLASGRLPGGCSVENNDFRPAPHFPMGDDTLSLGITSGGRYVDMLLVGDVQYREDGRSETFRYESVSTQGADWADHKVKNVLELRVENGSPVAFTMAKYKETKNLFGGTSWKETDSMVCR